MKRLKRIICLFKKHQRIPIENPDKSITVHCYRCQSVLKKRKDYGLLKLGKIDIIWGNLNKIFSYVFGIQFVSTRFVEESKVDLVKLIMLEIEMKDLGLKE